VRGKLHYAGGGHELLELAAGGRERVDPRDQEGDEAGQGPE